MSKITKFEDLYAWQKARELSKAVYECSGIGKFNKDFPLREQIRKAAISTASNIVEGFERDGNREFINFLTIAKGSVHEVRAQIYLAYDLGYINDEDFQRILELTSETGNLVGGLIRHLLKTNFTGKKYK